MRICLFGSGLCKVQKRHQHHHEKHDGLFGGFHCLLGHWIWYRACKEIFGTKIQIDNFTAFDRVPETIHGLVQVVFSALGSKTTENMLTGFLTTLSLQPVQPLSPEALQNVRIYMPTSPTALLS